MEILYTIQLVYLLLCFGLSAVIDLGLNGVVSSPLHRARGVEGF